MDIQPLYLLMGKLVQERPTQCLELKIKLVEKETGLQMKMMDYFLGLLGICGRE